jgi:hypothetical protein
LLACHIMRVHRKRFPMDNPALNAFEAREEKWRVEAVRDASYLAAASVPG